MTLVHLITRLSMGGSARNTIDSAAAAARAGYRTLLVTGVSGTEIDVSQTARESGCELVLIPSLRREIAPGHDLTAICRIYRLIRDHQADIVHTHTSKAGFVGRWAARMAGVPVVIHTPHGHIFHDYYGPTLTQMFILLERLTARVSDRIVVLTERGAEEHLAHRIGRPEQYAAIPSGVDIDGLRSRKLTRTAARRALRWIDDELVILGVGRLVPVKGLDVAVRSLPDIVKEIPIARLVLLGDGPEKEHLQRLAKDLGVAARVTMTGAHAEIVSHLAAADLLVAPSRNEGMGRAIVEAMALGLPVVGSRVGGIPSVIADGKSGLLVPPDDPVTLARAVTRLLRDPLRRADMGTHGERLAENFSLRVMESKLLELYRELALEKGLVAPHAALEK